MLNFGSAKILPSVKNLRERFEYKKNALENALEKDKTTMDKCLKQELVPVFFEINGVKEVLGWQFRSGLLQPNSTIKEMNISFLGTGSMAYFGKNKVTTGDVLCLLSLQKVVFTHQPTLLVKGIGTIQLREEKDAYHPIEALHDAAAKYQGSFKEVVFGTGVTSRIKMAMETFFIPNFFLMIKSYVDSPENAEEKIKLIFNVLGHSRGAIESFYMINCVEGFLQALTCNKPLRIHELCQLSGLDEASLLDCINFYKANRIEHVFKLLAFDPVEGMLKVGDAASFFGHDTTINIHIKGLVKSLKIQCADMPASIKHAVINLADHEHRIAFQPTIPTFADNTEVSYKVQFGTHSLMMGNIGNANGDGQDAFSTVDYDEDTKNLAHSAIDKVKIESIYFLFNEHLPPFEQYVFRRIYSNEKKYSYQACANYLNESLNFELTYNQELFSFIENITEIKFKDNESRIQHIQENIDLRIECCKWIMSINKTVRDNAYFYLKRDINDFLYPTDIALQNSKAVWCSQMKKDTTSLTGLFTGKKYSLPTLSVAESRAVFIRKGTTLQTKTLVQLMPEQYETRRFSAACVDPTAETLSILLGFPKNKYNPQLLKIDFLYTKIHTKVFSLSKPEPVYTVQTLLSKPLGKDILSFFSLIKKSTLTKKQKIDAITLVLLRMDKYKTCNVDIFCTVVQHHIQNKFAALFNDSIILLKQHKPYQRILSFLKESVARINRYNTNYPTADYTKINLLKNKFAQWIKELDLHNVPEHLDSIITMIEKCATGYKEEYSFPKRLFQKCIRLNPEVDFTIILQHLLSEAHILKEELETQNISPIIAPLRKQVSEIILPLHASEITPLYQVKKDEPIPYLPEALDINLDVGIERLFEELSINKYTAKRSGPRRLESRRSFTK